MALGLLHHRSAVSVATSRVPPRTPPHPHPHPRHLQVLALSSSFLLVANPNLLTAFAYSYTGTYIQSHDLSRAAPATFVYGMRVDESVAPPVVYVCGSYRSQSYARLHLSFAPKCDVIIEVFAASLTRHVTMQIHSGYIIRRPRRRQRQLAVRQLVPQLYFCNTLHMYTYQMDTCMGMGFIDTEESRAPKVTSIDPTSGPRAGGSQIVVAGSGQRPRPHPLHTSHPTVVTCDSLPQAS